MTFVNISALTYPEGVEEEIERRFAARRRAVDQSPGFLGFELLRPVEGESRYFVVTRWENRDSYLAWREARTHADHTEDQRRGMSIDVYGFEVVQSD